MTSDPEYSRRLTQVAYERRRARAICDNDAPNLIISPKSLDETEINRLLADRVNYVMIFGAESIFFQDTVHALSADSYITSNANILGVHKDWLSHDARYARRAMLVDETGLVKEYPFHKPVPIHIAHILHLPVDYEKKIHQQLSHRLDESGISQINPYKGGSKRADDKARTHGLCDRYNAGIVFPKYTLISREYSTREIIKSLGKFVVDSEIQELVVQPNKGTEGQKVEVFPVSADLRIAEYIKSRLSPDDDAIVREKRGNVKYGQSLVNVAFRINVAWNGFEFAAESGYAQAAPDAETFIASRGRGGAMVDINEALEALYYPRCKKWVRFIPVHEDLDMIKTAAVNTAYALNAGLDPKYYLRFMGIDILLEIGENSELTPVVLEVNPRPAGLSHSTEIVGISINKPQFRISSEIFKFLANS
jgi:hypothetical protein